MFGVVMGAMLLAGVALVVGAQGPPPGRPFRWWSRSRTGRTNGGYF